MGLKIRVIGFLGILFVSLLFSFCPVEGQGMQEVDLYPQGDPGNATLNTSNDFYEEQLVLTTGPNPTDIYAPYPNTIFLGEWVTKPIAYPMNIEGELFFVLYAKGNLQDVRFTAHLTVNGIVVSDEMSTERQDLNESQPSLFLSSTVNTTGILELNYTHTVGLSLSLDHMDLQYLFGKNVTLIFGYSSFVQFSANSMRVSEIEGRDDPVTGNMIVTAIIKCSFGYEDFESATASTEPKYGNDFKEFPETIIDNATVEVEWEWNYAVTEGGSYPVTITAKDRNSNHWALTKDMHITTPSTEVDFSISSSDISLSNDPKKDKNTTISAEITGSGRRWTSYQVDIEFYDGSSLIDRITKKVSLGGTNEVSVLWVPDTTGSHVITVKIDPDEDIQELDENNNEASKNVDVKEGKDGDGGPCFGSLLVLGTVGIILFFGMRSRRAE